MTAWDDYLAAAQRLDAVRRTAAVVVAEQTKTLQAAREDLAGVRARLALQHARLLDTARQAGTALPDVSPTAADVAAAQATLGKGTPQSVRTSLGTARTALDNADAVLSGLADAGTGSTRPALRNAGIYGGYAMLAAILEILAFVTVDEQSGAALLVLGCAVVLPVFVFALGWLTVGALRPPVRTPVLGIAMSLLALLPLLAMAVWIGAQTLGR